MDQQHLWVGTHSWALVEILPNSDRHTVTDPFAIILSLEWIRNLAGGYKTSCSVDFYSPKALLRGATTRGSADDTKVEVFVLRLRGAKTREREGELGGDKEGDTRITMLEW